MENGNATTIPGSHSVRSTLWFLDDVDLYKTVKPYHLTFSPEKNVPRTNISHQSVNDVEIHDLRAWKGPLSFDQNGFTLLNLENIFDTPDYDSELALEKTYFKVLTERVGSMFPGSTVKVLDHRIRKRHNAFPISIGKDYTFGQPVRVAHVDHTGRSAAQAIKAKVKQEADAELSGRFLYVNAWRPLIGPNEDWPLALCDAASMKPAIDLEAADYVSEDSVKENYLAYYRERHRWFYMSKQKTNEVLLFRQHDSQHESPSGIPHAAFLNPDATGRGLRESIEVNLAVYWTGMKGQ